MNNLKSLKNYEFYMSIKHFKLGEGIWNSFRHVSGLKLNINDWVWNLGEFQINFKIISKRKLDQFEINKVSSKFTVNFELTHCPCKNSMFLGSKYALEIGSRIQT